MPEAVYILCALTSIACAVMLLRGYFNSKARFLLWSSLCFIGLTINNLLLVIDRVIYPGDDLMHPVVRTVVALVALSLLLYGLIWDAE